MPEITDEDAMIFAAWATEMWVKAHDALKGVRAEPDDGTPSWSIRHRDRVKRFEKALKKWDGIRQRITAVCPRKMSNIQQL